LSVTPVTIQRHIIEQMRRHPHASGDFSKLLNDLCLSAKIISYQVNKAGLLNILGIAGSENVHGETQKKLDVLKEQRVDLSTAIDDLLNDIANGDKYMKVYKQMKMYNDDELNPVLRGQK